MELTKLQQKIINASENRIAIEACAASLKTSTLTEKVRCLLRDGINPHNIAVITFTRMASAELIDRLGNDYKEGIFVGTIHALAARILSIRGYGKEVDEIAEKEDFDKLFELCNNFNLNNIFSWICLDEAQDTGEKELNFIFEKINPDNFFVVYDRRQSIYMWRNARPDLLIKYLKEKDATFYALNENFRNGYNILNFAKKIITATGMEDDSLAKTGFNGSVEECIYTPSLIYNKIKNSEDSYRDWAILTRTNSELDNILFYFKKNGIPCETFKQSDLKREDLLDRMNNDSVKILTIHSSKGLAFNNVAVIGARYWTIEERNICYVAATRAKKQLIWTSNQNKGKSKKKF